MSVFNLSPLSNKIVAFVLFLLIVFVGIVLDNHNWNPRTFVLEGTKFRDSDPTGTKGYDGQFAYYIASDPLNAYKISDIPGKRYQRILYPMLAFILSLGGRSVLLPWVMIGINLVAITLSVGILAELLRERNSVPLFSIVLVCFVGTLFALRADLNEPLAVLLSLMGLRAYENSNPYKAMVFFGLAGLTKEIGLAFPLALVLWEGIQKKWKNGSVLLGSFFPFLAWYLILQLIFGPTGKSLFPELLPFSGLRALNEPVSRIVVFIWVLIPVLVTGLWAFWEVLQSSPHKFSHDSLLVVVYFVVIAMLPQTTWKDPLAILRTSIGFLVALLLWLASHHPRLLPYAAALWVPSGLILFLVPGMI